MEGVEILFVKLFILLFPTSVLGIGQGYFIPAVEAVGINVSRSGIAKFTVLTNVDNTVTLRCNLYNFMPTSVSFRRSGEHIPASVVKNDSDHFPTYRIVTPLRGNVTGNYSCFVKMSSNITNTLYFVYAMEFRIEVFEGNSTNCLSSIGSHGVLGETVTSRCQGTGIQWATKNGSYYQWRLTRFSGIDDKNQTCLNKTSNITVCSLPQMNVTPYIQVFVMPTTFPSNVNDIKFECTSSPPRLMYWSIVGTRGDLLGYYNLKYNNVTIVGTNISIVQDAGWTSLQITETTAGGNGIYKVICFVYETHVTLATAELDKLENSPLETFPVHPTNCSNNNQFARNEIMETEDRNLTYVLIIIFLLLIIIVCIVIIIVSYFKVVKIATKTNEIVSNNPMEVQNDLNVNPVYHSIEEEENFKRMTEDMYNYVDY